MSVDARRPGGPRYFYVGSQEELAHHAAPLAQHLPLSIVTPESVLDEAVAGDVCLFFNEYFDRFRHLIPELRHRGCPTLYVIDGILEWRNAWDDGDSEARPWVMRPVLSDKVACIGWSQARVLNAWGNQGRCEVTGIARLDRLSPPPGAPRVPERRSHHVLIMTAKQAFYDDAQKQRVLHALNDVKAAISKSSSDLGVEIVAHWRLSQDLAGEIGVSNSLDDLSGRELIEQLSGVDAVITTSSTAMLEAMLLGLPTALLDYHNCPHYVPAAWTISAADHIVPVLEQLMNPPDVLMAHQSLLLDDALLHDGMAARRLAALARAMASIAADCQQQGKDMQFPERILDNAKPYLPLPVSMLFTDHPLGNADVDPTVRMDLDETRRRLDFVSSRLVEVEQSYSLRIGQAITGPLRWLRRWLNSE